GSTIGADVSAGHQLSYTLVVSNTGPSQATGVMVSDTLATGVTFAEAGFTPADAGVISTTVGSVVTWTVGALAPQTGVTLTLLVTVTGDASTITNTAWLWGTETGPAAAITSVVTNTVYTAAPLTVTISGPSAGTIGEASLFTATTNVTASFPITFVWSISSTEIITHAVLYRLTDTVTYKWADSGSNAITTTVANAAGSVTNSITTTIALIPSGLVASRPRDAHIYLPLVQRTSPTGGP
ncbi:MAG: hypothetical protein Q7U96_04090, partial [Chloroflexota bacterium]|nr:hypothetical protein [Chloroflexota bacterium]